MMKQEFDKLVELTTSPECYERIEWVYMNCPFFSNANGKAEIAEFYKKYDMNGIERLYRETLEIEKMKQENEKLKERVKSLRTPTGTNMKQADYEKLEKAAKAEVGHTDTNTLLTDEEAKVLVNDEFGFEASRIVILHEAEIDDSEPDSRYVKIKKIPRIPLYESTDWNYVRFNVRGCAGEWYYEMINGGLYQVSI
jgi:hypothetical protein